MIRERLKLASPLTPLFRFSSSRLSLFLAFHNLFVVADGPCFIVVAFALPDNLPQLWVPPDGPGWIIPTAIDYDGNGQTFWGNAAAERPNPRIWFKLFIKGSPAVDLQGHNLVGATGGTVGHDNADRLIGDFLSVLQQQLRVHLQGYGPARIEWCFTEPGCWSDEGRLDFRNIVQDRVFNGHARDVSYVSEAEAAAEYTTAEGVYRGLIQVSSRGSSEYSLSGRGDC